MKKSMLFCCLLFLGLCLCAGSAQANPKQYGPSVYKETADRMGFNDADGDGVDDDGYMTMHSTLMHWDTGLGQETKLCEL